MAEKEEEAFVETEGSANGNKQIVLQDNALNDGNLGNKEDPKQEKNGDNSSGNPEETTAKCNSTLENFPTTTDNGFIAEHSDGDLPQSDSDGDANYSSSYRSDNDSQAPSSRRESLISTTDSKDDTSESTADVSSSRESFIKLNRELSMISMIGYPNEEEESRRLEALRSAITLQAEAADLRRLEFKRRQEALLNRKNKLSEKQYKNRNLPFPNSGRTSLGATLRVEYTTPNSGSLKNVHFNSEIHPQALQSKRKTTTF